MADCADEEMGVNDETMTADESEEEYDYQCCATLSLVRKVGTEILEFVYDEVFVEVASNKKQGQEQEEAVTGNDAPNKEESNEIEMTENNKELHVPVVEEKDELEMTENNKELPVVEEKDELEMTENNKELPVVEEKDELEITENNKELPVFDEDEFDSETETTLPYGEDGKTENTVDRNVFDIVEKLVNNVVKDDSTDEIQSGNDVEVSLSKETDPNNACTASINVTSSNSTLTAKFSEEQIPRSYGIKENRNTSIGELEDKSNKEMQDSVVQNTRTDEVVSDIQSPTECETDQRNNALTLKVCSSEETQPEHTVPEIPRPSKIIESMGTTTNSTSISEPEGKPNEESHDSLARDVYAHDSRSVMLPAELQSHTDRRDVCERNTPTRTSESGTDIKRNNNQSAKSSWSTVKEDAASSVIVIEPVSDDNQTHSADESVPAKRLKLTETNNHGQIPLNSRHYEGCIDVDEKNIRGDTSFEAADKVAVAPSAGANNVEQELDAIAQLTPVPFPGQAFPSTKKQGGYKCLMCNQV